MYSLYKELNLSDRQKLRNSSMFFFIFTCFLILLHPITWNALDYFLHIGKTSEKPCFESFIEVALAYSKHILKMRKAITIIMMGAEGAEWKSNGHESFPEVCVCLRFEYISVLTLCGS